MSLLTLPFESCRYTFAIGIGFVRQVTVKAFYYEQAVERARDALDKSYAKRGDEAPVAFDLTPCESGACMTSPVTDRELMEILDK